MGNAFPKREYNSFVFFEHINKEDADLKGMSLGVPFNNQVGFSSTIHWTRYKGLLRSYSKNILELGVFLLKIYEWSALVISTSLFLK